MMPCGYITGRSTYDTTTGKYIGDAVKIAMSTWTNLMRTLLEPTFVWHYHQIDEETHNDEIIAQNELDVEKEILDDRLDELENLFLPDRIYYNQTTPEPSARSLQQFIDAYLYQEGLDLAPLWIHHNEVTRGIQLGFAYNQAGYIDEFTDAAAINDLDRVLDWDRSSSGWDARSTELKLFISIRRVVAVDDEITLNVELGWNIGGPKPLRAFSMLPATLLNSIPGTWNEWGYGDCRPTRRGGLGLSYEPLLNAHPLANHFP